MMPELMLVQSPIRTAAEETLVNAMRHHHRIRRAYDWMIKARRCQQVLMAVLLITGAVSTIGPDFGIGGTVGFDSQVNERRFLYYACVFVFLIVISTYSLAECTSRARLATLVLFYLVFGFFSLVDETYTPHELQRRAIILWFLVGTIVTIAAVYRLYRRA
jgi:hypothetical protein